MKREDVFDLLAAFSLCLILLTLVGLAITRDSNLHRMEEAAVHRGYGTFDNAGNFHWK